MNVVIPRVRLVEFHEDRIRRPIAGSLLQESTDDMMSEPINTQVDRWLATSEHVLLATRAAHVSKQLPVESQRAIAISYCLTVAHKGDVVQALYGQEFEDAE